MAGNKPREHSCVRGISIFVAVVALIANVIAIIVFITGRGSLPALFSASTSNTMLTPTPTVSSIPTASQTFSDPFSPPYTPWIWWISLSIAFAVLAVVLSIRKGDIGSVGHAYAMFILYGFSWCFFGCCMCYMVAFLMTQDRFLSFIAVICLASLIIIYQLLKVLFEG